MTGELGECLSTLSRCVKDMCVKDESDAVEMLLVGVETRLQGEHAARVDATGAHTAATNAQMSLLEALCGGESDEREG